MSKGYAPGSWSQVAVERTKPTGRIVGIDIIPAQPPKGVSTIQGNFLSEGVREEVKRFLRDPNHGRPVASISTPIGTANATNETPDGVEDQTNADSEIETKPIAKKTRKKAADGPGKVVDVVLSDMSAPWPMESPNHWKRSLSDPYIRMMNTSGINYKDHAGSMVWITQVSPYSQGLSLTYDAGPMQCCSSVCAGYPENRRAFCL